MSDSDKCPKCGSSDIYQSEKYTGGGTDWREYTCQSCGNRVDENRGPALWKILSDDREKTEAAQTRAQASWFKRLLKFIGLS